ncbi:LamG-like jellyroll fold domain-containing protein [Ruania halotolerans]|uniref:LamG-like jellyroll fold domain-containing protein n=1 Tax=Ruania halotolerans TaxID=2897773 RepID=UPI001E49C6D0|nr:LamG-like jellyroll fold domain-containing protein [Ruania halotolerans]UFU06466.1 hypothetical protein LQF10_18925 [Ruania halotolerans]
MSPHLQRRRSRPFPSRSHLTGTVAGALTAALAFGLLAASPATAEEGDVFSSTWELETDASDSVEDRDGEVLEDVTFAGGSAHFSASDDSEIRLPYERNLEPGNGEWTLELTDIVPDTRTGSHQAVATSRSSNNQGWAFYIMPNGEMRFWMRTVGQGPWAQFSTGVIAQPGTSYDATVTYVPGSVTVEISGGAEVTVTDQAGIPLINNGNSPIRLGNGDDHGDGFFYNGSLGEITISSAPRVEPWAACEAASDGSATVSPPDPSVLERPIPEDEITQLSLEAAQNANRYITTTYWDETFAEETGEYIPLSRRVGSPEYALRGVAMSAVNMAILVATGSYDAADTGVDEAVVRERIVRLVSSAAAEHRANEPRGWGPEESRWQSSLWAYYNGFAAWLLWDDFSAAQQACVTNMVTMEANEMVDPEYYRDASGTIVIPGDTKAEENTWRSSLSGLAATMMPTAGNSAQWRSDAIDLALAGWATPEDVEGSETVNGRALSELLEGSNVESDGTVENHNLMHPIYMLAFDQNVNTALTQQLAGQSPAAAFLHNIDLTYEAFVDLEFDSPPWQAPGGTIYVPGESTIYYPDGNDWGTTFPLYFAQGDVIADTYDVDGDVSAPASEWAVRHLEDAIALQDRFEDGHTYLDTTESNYGLREERTAQIAAHTFLTRFLNAEQACVTDRPYTSDTTDPLLGELELVRELMGTQAWEDLSADIRAAIAEALDRLEGARTSGSGAVVTTALRELQLELAAAGESEVVDEIRGVIAAAQECTIELPIAVTAPDEADAGDEIRIGLTGAEPDTEYALLIDGVQQTTLLTGGDGAGVAELALPGDAQGSVTVRAVSGDSSAEATIAIRVPDTEEPTPDPTDEPTDGGTQTPDEDGSSDADDPGQDGSDDGSGDLADTGATPAVAILAVIAALALAGGAILLTARRRVNAGR